MLCAICTLLDTVDRWTLYGLQLVLSLGTWSVPGILYKYSKYRFVKRKLTSWIFPRKPFQTFIWLQYYKVLCRYCKMQIWSFLTTPSFFIFGIQNCDSGFIVFRTFAPKKDFIIVFIYWNPLSASGRCVLQWLTRTVLLSILFDILMAPALLWSTHYVHCLDFLIFLLFLSNTCIPSSYSGQEWTSGGLSILSFFCFPAFCVRQ